MKVVSFAVIILAVASCGEFTSSTFGDRNSNVNDTSRADFYPNDQLLISARNQFRNKNYGKANTLFKKAIDTGSNDPQAWLGYAATSDMLNRFDKSDVAYRKLQPMIGNRIEYHNNLGYSYLLRGNLRAARREILKAYEMDPSNQFAANNIELLRNSISYPKRGEKLSTGI